MERIRYRTREDGSLISVQTFKNPTNGAEYQIVVGPVGWHIQDANNPNLVAAQETSKSLNASKKCARQALEKLGVPMIMERRAPRTPKV